MTFGVNFICTTQKKRRIGHFAGYKRGSVLLWVILQAGKATLIFKDVWGLRSMRHREPRNSP